MRQAIAVLAAFTLLAQDAVLARPASSGKAVPVAITWKELGSAVVGRRIRVNVPDGTQVEGEILAVRSDSLVMDIARTSDKRAHPRGQDEIPRAGITEVWVVRDGGPVFRIFLAVGAAVGSVMGVSWATVITNSVAMAVTGILLLVPLAAVGGYYAGKAIDRRSTRIEILPDPAAPAAGKEVAQ